VTDVVIVAGEASGDQLAADLVERVHRVRPDVRFYGVTGPRMRAQGVLSWGDAETLSVRGLIEVLPSLPRILRLKRELVRHASALRPALFIGVDAPDFNLRLAAVMKGQGVRVLQYVCPTFWAWRAERVQTFRERTDRMLCIFPFEPDLLAKHGVQATFVGHPMTRARLADADRLRLRRTLLPEDADPATPIVAMLPGSRLGEVSAHAEILIDTMLHLAREAPTMRFLVPLPTRATRERFERALWAKGESLLGQTRLMFGHADYALRSADVAVVASGTATLEAAMHGCPQVVFYRLNALTYRLLRRRLTTPWVAQPNIIAGASVVPERLQHEATPERLAADVSMLLGDDALRARMLEAYRAIRDRLSPPELTERDVLAETVLAELAS